MASGDSRRERAEEGKRDLRRKVECGPSVSVKDNKDGLKRFQELLVDNSRTNERFCLPAALD